MPDGLEEKKLGFAYWFASQKLLLKNILIIGLIVFNILLAAYILYFLIFNLTIYTDQYQSQLDSLVQPLADYQRIREQKLPQPIQIGEINTLSHAQGIDIVAQITNPNTKWWTKFDYQFKIDGELTEPANGFILPEETKNIVALLVENGSQVSDLVMTNIHWLKEIDYLELYKARFNFTVDNIQFISSGELGIGEDVPISRLQFSVTNNTAFDYRNIKFIIFLKAGAQTVAVNQTISGQIQSLQTKDLELSFFQKLPTITSVDIFPEVNILDEEVFL